MAFLWVASKRGWINTDNHTAWWPQDAREVPQPLYIDLINAHSNGAELVTGEDGLPRAVYPPGMLHSRKAKAIDEAYEMAFAPFRARYPQTEVAGWSEQVRAMELFDANPEAPNVVLAELAAGNQCTLAEMAARIRVKREQYLVIYGRLTGQRQALERALNAIAADAPDLAQEIAAIDESTLYSVADELRAQLGGE